jgi:hypothetical protein
MIISQPRRGVFFHKPASENSPVRGTAQVGYLADFDLILNFLAACPKGRAADGQPVFRSSVLAAHR